MCSSKWALIIFEANFSYICTFETNSGKPLPLWALLFSIAEYGVVFKLPYWESWGFWGAAGAQGSGGCHGQEVEAEWVGSSLSSANAALPWTVHTEWFRGNTFEGYHVGDWDSIALGEEKRSKPWDPQVMELIVTNLDEAYKGFTCINAELFSPSYNWGNRDLAKVSNLTKIIEFRGGEIRIWAQIPGLRPCHSFYQEFCPPLTHSPFTSLIPTLCGSQLTDTCTGNLLWPTHLS